MSKNSAQPQDKYVLRLPDGMRDRIKLSAAINNRSMNAEIIAALEERFPPATTIEELVWYAKELAIRFTDTDDVRDAAELKEILKELVGHFEEKGLSK